MKMQSTEPSRRTPRDDEMPALLDALAASGGNTSAFARERGLAPWKLYKARRMADAKPERRPRREVSTDFVPIKIVEERVRSPHALELVLSSGHRLLIPSGCDEATLQRVVGVLASC